MTRNPIDTRDEAPAQDLQAQSVVAESGWRLGYRPALDGLRGLAVLLVILRHSGLPGVESSGAVGVSLFFVLSGFLITSLLVEERKRTTSVSLTAFYQRRVLRLLPALVVVIVLVTAFSMMVGVAHNPLLRAAAALAYVGNWVQAAGMSLGLLGHTWTLAVEEQFYLLWPLVLIALLRWRRGGLGVLLWFAIGAAALSTIERPVLAGLGASEDRLTFGGDLYIAALMLGCALSIWMESNRGLRLPAVIGAGSLVALVAFSAVPLDLFLNGPGTVVAPLATLAIAGLLTPGTGTRLLSMRPLVATGKISYGLYLWHAPLLAWAASAGLLSPFSLPLLVAVSFALAVASYRFVEQPFLRRKAHMRHTPATGALPEPSA
jgi:peptidoglycan/LPS O-acetylase OafA/YrhL